MGDGAPQIIEPTRIPGYDGDAKPFSEGDQLTNPRVDEVSSDWDSELSLSTSSVDSEFTTFLNDQHGIDVKN